MKLKVSCNMQLVNMVLQNCILFFITYFGLVDQTTLTTSKIQSKWHEVIRAKSCEIFYSSFLNRESEFWSSEELLAQHIGHERHELANGRALWGRSTSLPYTHALTHTHLHTHTHALTRILVLVRTHVMSDVKKWEEKEEERQVFKIQAVPSER